MQIPLSQTFPHAPQFAGSVFVSTHAPTQLVYPVAHPHVPPVQTECVPHPVPSGLLLASVQTGSPVLQSIAPFLHLFVEVHAAPAVHATQLPFLQTSEVPQLVPFVTFAPVSSHVETPVVHDVLPTWHAFEGVQLASAVQSTQLPS